MSKFAYCIGFLLLFFISGFRFDVGSDWDAYRDFYNDEEILNYYFEPGFVLFAYIIKSLGFSYIGFQIACSLWLFLPFYVGYKNKFLDKQILFLLYASIFFVTFMGGVRLSISLSIATLAFFYLIKDCKFKFILLVIIASTIHVGSSVLIFGYLIARNLKSQIFVFYLLPASVLIGFLIDTESILQLNNLSDIDKFSSYAGRANVDEEFDSSFKDFAILAERLVSILSLYFIYFKVTDKKNSNWFLPNWELLFKIATFSAIFYCAFHLSARTFAGRGSLVFRVPEVFLWANVIIVFTRSRKWHSEFFLRIAIFLYSIIKTSITFSPYYYYPYVTIFNA